MTTPVPIGPAINTKVLGIATNFPAGSVMPPDNLYQTPVLSIANAPVTPDNIIRITIHIVGIINISALVSPTLSGSLIGYLNAGAGTWSPLGLTRLPNGPSYAVGDTPLFSANQSSESYFHLTGLFRATQANVTVGAYLMATERNPPMDAAAEFRFSANSGYVLAEQIA